MYERKIKCFKHNKINFNNKNLISLKILTTKNTTYFIIYLYISEFLGAFPNCDFQTCLKL